MLRISEPTIKKFPTEVFCYPFCDHSVLARNALNKQFCFHLKDICNKPRKSQPKIKVGICSVGYRGDFLKEYIPVIICPNRFNEKAIFSTIKKLYLRDWGSNVEWVSEVSMGVGGSVDYVAIKRNRRNNTIEKFLCVEFQAAGTTGTPWQAVLDLKSKGKFVKEDYPYGINWANEFMKTMMQQVYKKGRIINYWKQKIIFVIQDVALDYLRYTVDTTSLRPPRDTDPIHFCTFALQWKGRKWFLSFKERVSTDLDGINKILGGAGTQNYLTVDNFKSNVIRKGIADGVF